jgi:hypothetical protein
MANADTITRMGVPYPVAIEMARQMTAGAGNGNADRLIAVGGTPGQAAELTAQINAAAFSAHKLAAAGFHSTFAKLLKEHSGL